MIADRTGYVLYGILANYQTGFDYKYIRTAGTLDPIQRLEFMNGPKLHLLKRDHWARQSLQSSVVHEVSE